MGIISKGLLRVRKILPYPRSFPPKHSFEIGWSKKNSSFSFFFFSNFSTVKVTRREFHSTFFFVLLRSSSSLSGTEKFLARILCFDLLEEAHASCCHPGQWLLTTCLGRRMGGERYVRGYVRSDIQRHWSVLATFAPTSGINGRHVVLDLYPPSPPAHFPLWLFRVEMTACRQLVKANLKILIYSTRFSLSSSTHPCIDLFLQNFLPPPPPCFRVYLYIIKGKDEL